MKTYFENAEIFRNFDDEIFSNAVDVGAIVQGAGQLTQGVGQITQSKAQIESAKLDIQKLAEARCGKRRGTKKKKDKFDKCAQPIFQQYDQEQKELKKIKQQEIDNQQNNQKMALIQAEKKQKSSQTNLYIGVGVFVLLVGVVIYFKQKS